MATLHATPTAVHDTPVHWSSPASEALADGSGVRRNPSSNGGHSCLQPRHILVPTDFSSASRRAFGHASDFAAVFKSRVTLVHVIEPMVLPPGYGHPSPNTPEDEGRQVLAVRRRLSELAAGLGSLHRAETSIRFGRPWQEVVDLVDELGIDLIILTSHGRTGLRKTLMGGVAEKIIRHTHCRVFVVRPEETDFSD